MPFHRRGARGAAYRGLRCFSLLCSEVRARAGKAGAAGCGSGVPPGPQEPAEWRPATRGRARPWARVPPGAPTRHHAPWTPGTRGPARSAPRWGICPGSGRAAAPPRPAPAPLVLPPSSRPPHPRTAYTGRRRTARGLGTGSQVVALRCPPLPLRDKAPFSLFICIFSTNV